MVLYYADLTATKAVENCKGPQRFMDKMKGRTISDSLSMINSPIGDIINIWV